MHRISGYTGMVLGVWCPEGQPAPDHRPSRIPAQEALVLILCILCIHVRKTNMENRIKGTWSLFRIGHEDSLFHSRMIRPPGRGRRNLPETNRRSYPRRDWRRLNRDPPKVGKGKRFSARPAGAIWNSGRVSRAPATVRRRAEPLLRVREAGAGRPGARRTQAWRRQPCRLGIS